MLKRLRRNKNHALPPLPSDVLDPRLPQELIERVIEYCAWNERTLRACSLVSRNWVTPSRRYLFGIIRLHTHASVAAFLVLVASSPHNIISFVRKLDIMEFDSASPPKAWMRHLFHRLPYFPYLECVAVQMVPNSYHWKWGSHLSKDIRMAFTDLFVGITKLELSAMFSSIYELCELICSFPQLRSLVLNGANWQSDSNSDSILTIPALRDLSLGSTSSKQVLITWILTGSTKEAFLGTRSARFTSIRQTEAPAVATYLHAIGPFLEDLELEFSGLEAFYIVEADNPKLKVPHRKLRLYYCQRFILNNSFFLAAAFVTLIDLAHNSNLRRLHLSNLLLGESREIGILFYGYPPARWVVAMLSQVSSPLEELQLTVVIEKHSKRVKSEDITTIANALARPRFAKLRLVWWDFVQSSVSGDSYWEMNVEWEKYEIRRAFGVVEWGGLLRISESR
jgi:hypothetical protein